MVKRGEIWWVELPTVKRRPFAVLTRDAAIPLLSKVLAVPATSHVRGAPSEVMLDEDDGMPRECVLAFDNMTQVPKSAFMERICVLRGDRLVEVCRALTRTTGC
jgi:mRNA interferase MazF